MNEYKPMITKIIKVHTGTMKAQNNQRTGGSFNGLVR